MNQRGFTLIETFIAITVLLFAILGPMTLVSRSIADASYAANQITAFYLAQEGLELVINRREQNEGLPNGKNRWLEGLEACQDKLCKIYLDANTDASNIVVEECNIGGCDDLVLDDVGRYTYTDLVTDGGKPTIFNRSIIIKTQNRLPITNSDGQPGFLTVNVVVDVVVSWDDKGRNRSFTISTLLTD